MKKIIYLTFCALLLISFWSFADAEFIPDSSKCYSTDPDGYLNVKSWPGWDNYCDACGSSSCCGDQGPYCKCPCDVSYCLKDKCVKLEKVCDFVDYSPNMTVHCHGCDWIKEPRSNWHGIPTMNIDTPTNYDKWKANGCCHYHKAFGVISGEGCGGECLNYKLGFAAAHGSKICASDADCKTTTTTKGGTICKTGETNPHYTCDEVNKYDYVNKSYTGTYCVKKDWCGVTNCDIKNNKSEKKSMYIQGVWFSDAIYYYNDRCKVCPAGQKYPHTECKEKTITYYDRILHKNVNYTYYTCEKIDSCGADKCDYSKNVSKGLGEYQDYDYYGKPYTVYDKYVSESAECKPTTTTLPKSTTTSSSTTTSTKPSDSSNRYVCDPNAEKVDSYGVCILDNANKYPNAKTCSTKNNKTKLVEIPCSSGKSDRTCLKTLSYNIDCIDNVPTPTQTTTKATSPTPTYCYISFLRFYDEKKDYEYTDAYSIFSKPDQGILDNPKLEYTASDCDKCTLTIDPVVDSFVSKNPNIFGNLIGELIKGYENRYVFDRSIFNGESIILDVNDLTPGSYNITLTCTDPVTKATEIKTLKLKVFGQFRWREIVPVIN